MSRTTVFFVILTILLVAAAGVTLGISHTNTPSVNAIKIRQSLTLLTGLPDLSVYLESPSERFRTLTDTGALFETDPFASDTDFSAIIYKKAPGND
ncbi:hypothetical protein ACMC5R_09400 [Deferribacteres bacterium DY0037]|uniref:hypothetical protein n=1 Tax=Denitrovibrio acetiphilus TaxID=118000 RepID=UPI00019B3CAC|nr:hypothetical protein [Denitrovibrio acetiphilus]